MLDRAKFDYVFKEGEEAIAALPTETTEDAERLVDAVMALIENACIESMLKEPADRTSPQSIGGTKKSPI